MNFARSTLNDKIKIDSMASVPLLNIEHEQRQLPPDDHVVQCKDFQAFQLQMKQLRFVDDRIVNELNGDMMRSSDPSGQCGRLHSLISKTHVIRDSAIKRCIRESAAVITDLKASGDEDASILLRKEQRRLRLFQTELNIEEIVKDRTMSAFKERCRFYYDS